MDIGHFIYIQTRLLFVGFTWTKNGWVDVWTYTVDDREGFWLLTNTKLKTIDALLIGLFRSDVQLKTHRLEMDFAVGMKLFL